MKKRSLAGRIFQSRFFIVGLTAILFLLVVGFFRSFWRDYQIRQEIKQMEITRQNLEDKKIKTLELIEEMEGDNLAEKEARVNFGLIKPGEQVVFITEGTKKINETKNKNVEQNNKSNLTLWWEYFFAPKTN